MVNFAKKGHDILRDWMHKKSKPIALGVVLLAMVLVIAVSVAAGSAAFQRTAAAIPVAPLQEATPTATDATSVAGSTAGILWMGLAIMAIILLPVITRRSFWQ